jgi:hypothetical protein
VRPKEPDGSRFIIETRHKKIFIRCQYAFPIFYKEQRGTCLWDHTGFLFLVCSAELAREANLVPGAGAHRDDYRLCHELDK